jgi:thioredoxin 1
MNLETISSMTGIMELNEQNFEQLLKTTDKLIIVEFYQFDCPFCAEIAPVYEEMSKQMAEDAVFTRVDTVGNMDLATQFGIVGTPTFKMFCKDKLVGEVFGQTNATALRNTIKDAIRHQAVCAAKRKMTFELDGYG